MRHLNTICLAIATALSCGAIAQTVNRTMTPQAIVPLAQSSFNEYLEFLKMPSDAVVPSDIQKNAAFLERAFTQRGFNTRQLANNGKPLVFAEFGTKVPGAKTILLYMHFDTQPVVPTEWAQPDPWLPVLKQRDANGKWQIVPTERLFAQTLDPELRVFARGSSDDKGPIMMLLAAFDGMKASGIAPAVNVKVLLDSEEEKGSPYISDVIRANLELLSCDGIVIHDGPSHASERPTLIFGNRGAALATLTVYGPKAPLHSGHYGNYVPNPAMRMAQLLASMKDDDGRVTIKGYYDPVTLTDSEKAILARTGDDEVAIRKRTGIARAERVGGNYQEALQFPSLNIRGMASGSVGDKAANVVPRMAVTELDLRTTPETPPDYLFDLVQKHIQSQGYHLVNGEPSDADRAAYDKLASFTMARGGKAVRTPLDSPLGAWAYNILKAQALSTQGAGSVIAASAEPVRIRMMGGSVPTDSLVDTLGVPFVILPLVNGDNNQHTYDENLRIGNYLNGIRLVQSIVTTPL
jgi:acetylornithine deacetylase/succinyl-diaminopimelate desuccinylase-like protein